MNYHEMCDQKTFDRVLAQAFLNLGEKWTEDGGTMLRWSQRSRVVADGMLHSDLVADQAYRRLVDQRDGVIARVRISPATITRTFGLLPSLRGLDPLLS